jgi:hypothetical protein
MHRKICALLQAILVLFLLSCSGKSSDGEVDCGDEKTLAEPIINGTAMWDPAVVTLTNAQALAVGFLELGGRGGCSGTLIAPRTVLTAAHCVYSRPSYVRFYTGGNFLTPEGVYRALEYHAHPYYGAEYVDYDIGIVILESDPMDDGVIPIPVHLEPAQRLAGEDVQAVGFGITSLSGGSNTRKWWTVIQVVSETPTIYTTSGGGVTGPCSGDSGGPMLWQDPELGVQVYAPVSSVDGDGGCVGLAWYPRTDYADNAAFIRTYLPEDPCGDETPQGRCDGNTAIWCEGYTVMSDDCETWETCMLNGDGNYRCVLTDPCRGETWEGRCNEDGAAVWCEDGSIMVHGCPDFGYYCGTGEDGLTRCQPPGPCQAEGLDWVGTCTVDGHVRWCEDGVIKDRDCWKCDQDCGWAGDVLGNYCIDRT